MLIIRNNPIKVDQNIWADSYVKCWVNDNTEKYFTLFVSKELQNAHAKETTTHSIRMFKISTQKSQCQLRQECEAMEVL